MASDKATTWQRINAHDELGLDWWSLSDEYFWGEEAVLYRCTVCYRALVFGINRDKGGLDDYWLYEVQSHDQEGAAGACLWGQKIRFGSEREALAYMERRLAEPCPCQPRPEEG